MRVSVIIPTVNEEREIGELINHLNLCEGGPFEVLVCDAGSTDQTTDLAQKLGARVIRCKVKSRSSQMNAGAREATGDFLFFIHADSRPHRQFATRALQAIEQGYQAAGYRFRFRSTSRLLAINSFFTRFNWLFVRGGDQGIFLARQAWQQFGPFDEAMLIMEEYKLLCDLRKAGVFKLLPLATSVSARKYQHNGWLRVQWANLRIVLLYKLGFPQHYMAGAYRRWLGNGTAVDR